MLQTTLQLSACREEEQAGQPEYLQEKIKL